MQAMLDNLDIYTDNIAKSFQLPAVSIAVWSNNQLLVSASGILNLNTGVEATTNSIFQIGSITKVFTTCLVMQLVDEGRVELDKPVKCYLPDFQIADAQASRTITVRQLLNHTNGIDGDYFPDDEGHQGNLIARYVDRCSMLPLVHPVGKMFCYSNAAFVVAGRLVEVIRGISWHQAMKKFIFQPLGLNHAIADPKDVIRYRTAMGHVLGEGKEAGQWVLPDKAYWALGMAPAGTSPAMTAGDLILFARAHLDGGLSINGERWLSESAIAEMQKPSKTWPLQSQIKRNHVGLGWMISDYSKTSSRVIHHSGATMGFLSALQIIPERDCAVAILLNGFSPTALNAISNELLQQLTGIDNREPDIAPVRAPKGFQHLTGHYESLDSAVDIIIDQQQLTAVLTPKLDPIPPQTLVLRHIEGGCYAAYREDGTRSMNITFIEDDGHKVPRFVFIGVRLIPRRS